MVRCFATIEVVLLLVPDRNAYPQEKPPVVRQSKEGVHFDFQDMDIRIVIGSLAEAGGLNVVHAGLPAIPITLRTSQPVQVSEIRGLLTNIVESNGLRITEQDGVLRVDQRPPPAPPPAQAPQSSSELRLFVHRLKHAPAARLAGTIQMLFGGGGFRVDASRGRSSLSEELRRQQIPPTIPGVSGNGGAANPDAGTRVLPGQVTGQIQVVPDELTNSLLVRASAGDWEVIRSAIEALDIRPLQVMIEVLIAEVRRNRIFELGVSASAEPQHSDDIGGRIGGSLTGGTNGDFALEIMDLGPISANVLISALSSRAEVTILSRPVILAKNNQEARILVGSERPFVQVFRSLPTDAAVRDQVVQYRDVGTSLTIIPTINPDGYVSLDLIQEVSTATSEIQFGAPVISTREAATQLLVKDSQTVVIGGLLDRQQDRTRSGIPVLKDIPLIGGLFGSTHRADIQTELFLFITPHIIRTDEEATQLREGMEQATDALKSRLPARTIIPPSKKDR